MATPKIRLKGFEGDWKTKKIGDISSFSKGRGYSKSDLRSQGHPIILYGRLYTNYSFSIESVDTFAELKENSLLSTGSEVVIPASGETAEDISIASAIKQKNIILGGDLNILTFDKEFDTTFMAMSISCSGTHTELSRYAQGKSVVHLRNSDISKADISFPNISEQQQIASYFTSLDSLIQSTTKKIDTLKQTKKACLQSMFPQEGETYPRVRFKGFEGEWKNIRIGDFGYTYSGLSGKTKEDFGCGDSKYITFLNVLNNSFINISQLESVKLKIGEKQNEVQKGDLFFNTSSETPDEVGLCSVLNQDVSDVYLNSFCFGFRVSNENIYSPFVTYYMRSNVGRKIMSVLAQGATRYNLSKSNFCKQDIFVPADISEQRKIASFFANLDQQISLQTQKLEKLKQIKAACLDKMFV